MRAKGNGLPQICAANLLRIVRGEVAYDRLRGRNGALIDQPNATDAAADDVERVLAIYEPRVDAEGIISDSSGAISGNFNMNVNITERKEDEEI